MRTRDKGNAPGQFTVDDLVEDSQRDSAIMAFPARIVDRAVSINLSDDELMILARARAQDPTVFDEEGSKPFFFNAEISNNRRDSYFSRMMASSLRNYAAGCDAGVAFQDSHNHYELPLGGSLKGRFVAPGGDGIAHVFAAFYTVPGMQQGGLPTNELIKGIRTGVTKDVSIGFYGGRSVCSICGGDMWDYRECPHWPGDTYDIADSKTGEQRVAEELVEDALLSEVSAVYDGACPGAAIQKALRALEGGVLNLKQARILEARYRIKLPTNRQLWLAHPGADAMKIKCTDCSEEYDQAEETRHKETEGHKAAVTEAARKAEEETARLAAEEETRKAAEEASRKAAEEGTRTAKDALAKDNITGTERDALVLEFEKIKAENTRLNQVNVELGAKVAELSPLADDGRTYRADLIEATISEGNRALGKGFNEESYRLILGNASLEAIDKIRAGFTGKGDKNFPPSRQSRDDATTEEPTTPAPTRVINDRAYGG